MKPMFHSQLPKALKPRSCGPHRCWKHDYTVSAETFSSPTSGSRQWARLATGSGPSSETSRLENAYGENCTALGDRRTATTEEDPSRTYELSSTLLTTRRTRAWKTQIGWALADGSGWRCGTSTSTDSNSS